METPTKVTRPGKSRYKCFLCKEGCDPKDGDWFNTKAQDGSQVFICHGCERTFKASAASGK